MSLQRLAALGAAIVLTGCLNTGEPGGGQQNYGFVFLETRQLTTGEYVLRPNAIFYRTGLVNLPGSGGTFDDCGVGPYVEPGPGTFPPVIDAGESIMMSLSGSQALLVPEPQQSGPLRYVIPDDGTFEFEPGDTVTLEIPGASPGFPSWTLEAKTAEAFVPAEVPIPEEPTELQLTWTPAASGPNSRMAVQLRYFTETGQHEQLVCELNDDGQYRIDAAEAEGWRAAQVEGREAIFTRWRITGEAVSGSVLLVMSTFEVPTEQIAAEPQ